MDKVSIIILCILVVAVPLIVYKAALNYKNKKVVINKENSCADVGDRVSVRFQPTIENIEGVIRYAPKRPGDCYVIENNDGWFLPV